MQVVVTGCAGFIGGHLSETLLDAGHTVLGIDCLTDYYDVALKRRTLEGIARRPGFTFVEGDLRTTDLPAVLAGADAVLHLAGQPGVRLSWSDGFPVYVERNVLATQRLLEAVRITRPQRIVFASSSSVYGNATAYPTSEDVLPQPFSPYGVTKLAAEHLCNLYAENSGVPTTSLRYFSVYGPRQRPDMGLNKFIETIRLGGPIPLYGDGEQVRDFTFVTDVVAATIAAATADLRPGSVMNIAGGRPVTVNELLRQLSAAAGRELVVDRLPEQAGDVAMTAGTIDRARRLLDWEPQVGLAEGVRRQYEWQAASVS